MFEILNAWCEANGFDVSVQSSFDEEFWYDDVDSIIYWGQIRDDETIWIDFVKSLGLLNVDIIPIEIQAFCHELGHSETLCTMTDEDWAIYDFFGMMYPSARYSDDTQLAYYNLPIEKEATLWAVKFMNENLENLLTLAKECGIINT